MEPVGKPPKRPSITALEAFLLIPKSGQRKKEATLESASPPKANRKFDRNKKGKRVGIKVSKDKKIPSFTAFVISSDLKGIKIRAKKSKINIKKKINFFKKPPLKLKYMTARRE